MAHPAIKLTGLIILISLLSGCAANVALEAAPDSNNPKCAEMSVRLPEEIPALPNLAKRFTNAQATSAWGDPVAVIFRCGLEPVSVSSLPCVTVSEIDWLVDDSAAPTFRFVSFGREPAVEVIVDSAVASGVTALESVAGAVAVVEAEVRCTIAG